MPRSEPHHDYQQITATPARRCWLAPVCERAGGALLFAAVLFALTISQVGCPLAFADEPKAEAKKESNDSAAALASNPAVTPKDSWPLFRGNEYATGIASCNLASKLSVAWKRVVPQGSFVATAIIEGGVVYIGDLDGKFYALSLADGAEKWIFQNEAGFAAPAGIMNGKVFVGDVEGRFHCLDVATGKPVWQINEKDDKEKETGKLVGYFSTEAEINGGPTFDGDRVFVGSQDSKLYCLEQATGKLIWEHAIEDQIRCTPTIVDGRAFLAGCDGKLHLVYVKNGKSAGAIDIGAPTGSTPAVLGDLVYFGTQKGEFLGISWKEQKILWRFRDERSSLPYQSSAAVTDKFVVFGGRDKKVHCVNPTSGEILWQFKTRQKIDASPVVVEDRVYAPAMDGKIYVIDSAKGSEVSVFEAGGAFSASPAVAQQRLVIGNDDGTLYCFK